MGLARPLSGTAVDSHSTASAEAVATAQRRAERTTIALRGTGWQNSAVSLGKCLNSRSSRPFSPGKSRRSGELLSALCLHLRIFTIAELIRSVKLQEPHGRQDIVTREGREAPMMSEACQGRPGSVAQHGSSCESKAKAGRMFLISSGKSRQPTALAVCSNYTDNCNSTAIFQISGVKMLDMGETHHYHDFVTLENCISPSYPIGTTGAMQDLWTLTKDLGARAVDSTSYHTCWTIPEFRVQPCP